MPMEMMLVNKNFLGFFYQKKGFQASPFKGNHPKILPNFKLRPLKAEPIQNPKSKIQNRVTFGFLDC
jgi:hypothetical protein